MTSEELLSNLDSLGWRPDLAAQAYDHIASLGFRRDNGCLAAIATELVVDCQPITLRGLFYRVVSTGFFPSTASEYYKRLGRVMSTLRQSGLVPYEWIVDNLRSTIKPSSWSGLQDFAETVREAYRKDFWSNLESYVHVFCEKDAIAGTIAPVTRKYDVCLSPVRGYWSDSFAYEIGSQWTQIKKPIFAFYLGDYDPSGFDIERDLESKLRVHAGRPDIHWARLAIHESDFADFSLIELDVKKSDNRYAKFVAKHGERCAEVDALPPQELRRRVQEAITRLIPTEEWERLRTVEKAEQETFASLLQTI